MPEMKKETIKLKKAAQMFKAMGHTKRITIIKLLAKSKRMSVTKIHKALKIKQPIASYQLNILKNKSILHSERVGQNVYYSISHPGITNAINNILEILEE